ncbi:glycosyltransferase [Pedococcus soli]
MSDEHLLTNELRTLRSELDEARSEALSSRIRLLNTKTAQAAAVDRLEAELEAARAKAQQLETSLAVAANAPQRTASEIAERELKRVSGTGASAHRLTVNVAVGPDYFFGSQHHKDVRVIEQIALKNASLKARDVIARSATHLLLDYPGLRTIARLHARGVIDQAHTAVFSAWLPRSLLSLARVVADQNLLPEDKDDSLALHHLAISLWGVSVLDQRSTLIYAELLEEALAATELDLFAEAVDLASTHPVQMALLTANRLRRAEEGEDPTGWLDALNEQYVQSSLSPIEVGEWDADLLGRLHVSGPPEEDGPLVSVLMPTHNGSAHILTAIRSVLAQTWRRLELIVVDDCSDSEHWDFLKRMAPQDERLTLLRQDTNQGAYRARRRAFAQATGEFVTVHDDDDWSHPQKIETQVRHLVENPDEVANMSFMVRMDQDGYFTRINDNPQFSQKNYSSMLTRSALVKRLGNWDDLNRAADAEFHDRIHAATGRRVVAVEGPPLSIMRSRSGSLTSGEIRRGALDFGRQTYGLFYLLWHAEVRESQQTAETVTFSPEQRPFPVPVNLTAGQRQPDMGHLDVIYCTDIRFPGGNSSLTAAEIRAAHEAGLRVGLMHLSSPVLRAPRPANQSLRQTVADLGIPVLALEDSVSTSVVLVRNPTVLQYADNLASQIRTHRVLVVANTAPLSLNGTDASYDIDVAVQHAGRLFGASVVVSPESPHTRDLLRLTAPGMAINGEDWPGFVPDDVIAGEPRHTQSRRPVVGRHSRDHRLKWPDTLAEVEAAYVSDSFETRVLGGATSIAKVIDLGQSGVEVLPFDSVAPNEFLNGIDFWVYMHSAKLVESFGMSALEAMASGCVVVLPPYMEPLYGKGALYAEPSEVSGLVSDVWGDDDRYRKQSADALGVARSRFSTSAYVTRLRALVEDSSTSPAAAAIR